jgi:hypothetical protein
MAWPQGKRIRGRVKEISGVEFYPDDIHAGKPHRWHEMLHYGQPGTGFAECACGAIGVPYGGKET